MSAFEELGVLPEIIHSIEELGWQLPTSIQSEAVPLILGGGDVMAAAETGSGKTGAFALPILQVVHESLREIASGGTIKPAQVDIKNIALSPLDKDPLVTLDDSNLICKNPNTKDWGGVRGSVGLTKGKFYYEVKIHSGLPRVGWATKAAKLDIGIDRQSFGFGGTGKKSHNKAFLDYGKPYGPNDVIGSYIDLDSGTLGYTLNGQDLGKAFEIPQNMLGYAFFPAITIKGGEATMNFGGKPFQGKPAGYKGISEVTIEQTSSGSAPPKKGRSPLSLIVEPVRELAEQTHNAINSFMKYLPPPKIRTALVTGGAQTEMLLEQLKGADIVTGTPGRLLALLESGALDLTDIKFFVLDEADKLLEHIEIVTKIYDQLPKHRLQVLMFSATLHSPEILELSEKICRFPTWVDLKGKDFVPETVHHTMVVVDPIKYLQKLNTKTGPQTDGIHRKDQITFPPKTPESLSEAVKLLKPIILKEVIDAYKMDQAIIFVRTRVDADHLEAFLRGSSGRKGPVESEYSCAVLAGNRSDNDRRSNLNAFREGEIRFLICTDVAARGIDIKELPYVINMTLPDKPEDYIHRVGRVGRADNLGLAISLVSSVEEKVWYHQCPSRGSNCNDTKLLEMGGCAIWYNEPTYIKNIESRLGTEIEQLPETYKSLTNQQVTYGQKKNQQEQVGTRFIEHKEAINNEVAELHLLEIDVQRSFLLAKKWNNVAKS